MAAHDSAFRPETDDGAILESSSPCSLFHIIDVIIMSGQDVPTPYLCFLNENDQKRKFVSGSPLVKAGPSHRHARTGGLSISCLPPPPVCTAPFPGEQTCQVIKHRRHKYTVCTGNTLSDNILMTSVTAVVSGQLGPGIVVYAWPITQEEKIKHCPFVPTLRQ